METIRTQHQAAVALVALVAATLLTRSPVLVVLALQIPSQDQALPGAVAAVVAA
jgi:hypothetical protein